MGFFDRFSRRPKKRRKSKAQAQRELVTVETNSLRAALLKEVQKNPDLLASLAESTARKELGLPLGEGEMLGGQGHVPVEDYDPFSQIGQVLTLVDHLEEWRQDREDRGQSRGGLEGLLSDLVRGPVGQVLAQAVAMQLAAGSPAAAALAAPPSAPRSPQPSQVVAQDQELGLGAELPADSHTEPPGAENQAGVGPPWPQVLAQLRAICEAVPAEVAALWVGQAIREPDLEKWWLTFESSLYGPEAGEKGAAESDGGEEAPGEARQAPGEENSGELGL